MRHHHHASSAHTVPGVTIYISDFQRNIVDKLKKDFFSDPSQASLTCAVTGPIAVKDWSKITQEKSGVEVNGSMIKRSIQMKVIRFQDLMKSRLVPGVPGHKRLLLLLPDFCLVAHRPASAALMGYSVSLTLITSILAGFLREEEP